MFEYISTLAQLYTDRRAVTALEYGLIAALIAGVIVAAVASVGPRSSRTFAWAEEDSLGRLESALGALRLTLMRTGPRTP